VIWCITVSFPLSRVYVTVSEFFAAVRNWGEGKGRSSAYRGKRLLVSRSVIGTPDNEQSILAP